MKLRHETISRERAQGTQRGKGSSRGRLLCALCVLSRRNSEASRRGSATALVLGILALVAVYVVANSLVTRHLKADLKLIEQKQLKKYAAPKP